MSEKQLPNRAHWHASVGNVLFSHLTEMVYDQTPVEFTQQDLEVVEHNLKSIRWGEGRIAEPKAWSASFDIADRDLGHMRQVFKRIEPPSSETKVFAGQEQFTYYEDVILTITEGLNTQYYFPLNLGMAVSSQAEAREIKGFEVSSLQDIGRLMMRPDFQQLVNQAAFTANGVWRSMTNDFIRPHRHNPETIHQRFLPFEFDGSLNGKERQKVRLSFDFKEDGSVAFNKDFWDELIEQIRINNAPKVWHKTTSGCPVRHTKAHLGKSNLDTLQLTELSEYFGKPIDELKQTRSETVIQKGLARLALLLQIASESFELWPVTNYS